MNSICERSIYYHDRWAVYHGRRKEYYSAIKDDKSLKSAAVLEKYHHACAQELRNTEKPLSAKRKKSLFQDAEKAFK